MRQVLTINSNRRRRTQFVRVIAVFFLIYTGADISLPQYFCGGEEIANLSLRSNPITNDAGDVTEYSREKVLSSHSNQDQQPDREVPHGEDCFCCCAHVLPGLSFANVGHSVLTSPRSLRRMGQIPSPPLQSTYHPPRFA
ncbi:MAG: hypothetical protein H0W99_14585 [Acidobacteria bacterium]|nr:hypothetical protein [Acidobacteriota bacterium]